MTRRYALLLILVAVLSFKAGVAFDRWLHRPIRVGGFSVSVSDSSSAPPPGAPRCFSDGSVPCPAPRAPCVHNCSSSTDDDGPGDNELKLRTWTGPCPFDPLRNEACQQET